MTSGIVILIVEVMAIYLLVLWTHSLRGRFRLGPMYALLGSITAMMSWVTDAGLAVEAAGITFMIGSTVFYSSLLLGVFVIYVTDGPRSARTAILTIAGVSALVPLVAWLLHLQTGQLAASGLGRIPVPDLRINAASVVTTVVDMLFLAMAWEFFGGSRRWLSSWLRTLLTLLGVMWLDVLLFATLAFAGTEHYVSIMTGTLSSRLVISLFATPFISAYLHRLGRKEGLEIENRPILSILRQVASMQLELGAAHTEIERRRILEGENEELIRELRKTLSRMRTLEGLLPICSCCKKIRSAVQDGEHVISRWIPIDDYIRSATDVKFSHGICEECARKHYPEFMGEQTHGQTGGG
jgi:hypothetical protein